jgi:hypothetical protein
MWVGLFQHFKQPKTYFFDQFDLPRLKSLAPSSSQFYGMIWPWQPFSKQSPWRLLIQAPFEAATSQEACLQGAEALRLEPNIRLGSQNKPFTLW